MKNVAYEIQKAMWRILNPTAEPFEFLFGNWSERHDDALKYSMRFATIATDPPVEACSTDPVLWPPFRKRGHSLSQPLLRLPAPRKREPRQSLSQPAADSSLYTREPLTLLIPNGCWGRAVIGKLIKGEISR